MFQSSILLSVSHKKSPESLDTDISIIQGTHTCLEKNINLKYKNCAILLDFTFKLDNTPIVLILKTENILIKDFCLVIDSMVLDDLFVIPRSWHSGVVYDTNNNVTGDIGNTLYMPGSLRYQLSMPLIRNAEIVR